MKSNETSKKMIITSSIAFLAIIVAAVVMIFAKQLVESSKLSVAQNSEMQRTMAYSEVTDEDAKIDNCDYVQFNAYFLANLNGGNEATKLNGTCKNVNKKDMLYIDLNVLSNGQFKNGVIEVQGDNFSYNLDLVNDDVIKGTSTSGNATKINLGVISAGTQKLIQGQISANVNNINKYSSSVNKVILKGTFVSNNGTSTQISKTINLTADWYGELESSIYVYEKDVNFNYDNSNTVMFSFAMDENKKELLLKDNKIKVSIPALNGYNAEEINCVTTGDVAYNSNVLEILKQAEVNENGDIITKLPNSNTYTVMVKYPSEAIESITQETQELEVQIEGYYLAYNNSGEEFNNEIDTNIKKSNIVQETVKIIPIKVENEKKGNYKFNVKILDKTYNNKNNIFVLAKDKILEYFNNDDSENVFRYIVEWDAIISGKNNIQAIVMNEEDSKESYGDKFNDDIVDKYIETSAIYVENAEDVLVENGIITIYNNDSNEILAQFTKDNWNNYNAENPYIFVNGAVKHIRVETSGTKDLDSTKILKVYSIKEVNKDKFKNGYSSKDVQNIEVLYTFLQGTVKVLNKDAGENEQASTKDVKVNSFDMAYLQGRISYSQISVNQNKLLIGNTSTKEKIYIKTIVEDDRFDSNWKNGAFIVELPEEIVAMQVNSVTIDNANVQIEGYDLTKVDGKYILKINTTNEVEGTYTIIVDASLTTDSKVDGGTKEIKLYSYNELVNRYYKNIQDYYDLNLNDSVEDKVGSASTNIEIVSSQELLTYETVSNYIREKNQLDKWTSDVVIAPNIAEIENSEKHATINVVLNNKYHNAIKNVKVLGEFPVENNKYILNGQDLHTQFTAQLMEGGIVVPQELEGKVDVYYSEKIDVTKDLDNVENGWKTLSEFESIGDIKSYLIDFRDNAIEKNVEYVFSYDVVVPDNVEYNLVAYSNHAVFYDVETVEGILELSTEPSKVGIKYVSKYYLKIDEYQKGTENHISSIMHRIWWQELNQDGESVTRTEGVSGDYRINYIYKGIEYELEQYYNVSGDYELHKEVITFIVNEDNEVIVTGDVKWEYSKDILNIRIENDKYSVIITKRDEDTHESINNTYFEISSVTATQEKDGVFSTEERTDSLGRIKLTLPDGYYVAEEKVAASSYALEEDKNLRRIYFKVDNEVEVIPIIDFGILKSNYYVIYTVEDLVLLGKKVNEGDTFEGKTVVLANDIDFNVSSSYRDANDTVTFGDYNGDGNIQTIKEELTTGSGFKTIGIDDYVFEGDFFGNGRTISNLFMNSGEDNKGGLFGNVQNNNITRFNIKDARINVSSNDATGIINVARNSTIGKINVNNSNLKFSGDTSSSGIIGKAYDCTITELSVNGGNIELNSANNGVFAGYIENSGIYLCNNQADKVVASNVGMIVGNAVNSKIYKCNNYANFSGSNIGGIVQNISETKVKDCINYGNDASEASSSSAGIVHTMEGNSIIENCCNKGAITNGVGIAYKSNNSKILNCYNEGEITSNGNPVAGIVYENVFTDIMDCYNAGVIKGNSFVCGIAYSSKGSKIANCYNIGEVKDSYVSCGLFYEVDNCNVINCNNQGNITGLGLAAGIAYRIKNGCRIANCYNSGTIIGGTSVGLIDVMQGGVLLNSYNIGNVKTENGSASGIVSSITSGCTIFNCFSVGKLESKNGSVSGIVQNIASNVSYTILNCFYSSASKAIYTAAKGVDTIFAEGKYERISDEKAKSEEFVEMLNEGKLLIDFSIPSYNWKYNNNSYPTLIENSIQTDRDFVMTNKAVDKQVKVIKMDKVTGQKLEGAKIKVEQVIEQYGYTRYTEISTQVTDKNGICIFNLPGEDLGKVKYRITEIEAPVGYKIDTEYTIIEKGNRAIEVSLYNEKVEEITLQKQDDETGKALDNTKFCIYSVGETQDFAKDINGVYVGTKENDIYTVTTNREGLINLYLPNGVYKAVEVEAKEGYILEDDESKRTIYFEIDNNNIIFDKSNDIYEIRYIEDLVELSILVNTGHKFKGKTVRLINDLDFNNKESYRNADDSTSYPDYNGNGSKQSIKDELTTGNGFKPIGGIYNFEGDFDGNGKTISNLYMQGNGSYIGLFGRIYYSNIYNLTLKNANIYIYGSNLGLIGYATRSKISNISAIGTKTLQISGDSIGAIVGCAESCTISYCSNSAPVSMYGSGTGIGSVIGYAKDSEISNCSNASVINNGAQIGMVVGTINNTVLKNCYNTGKVSGGSAACIVFMAMNNSIVNKCTNTVDINTTGSVVGLVGVLQNSKLLNSYNTGNIVGTSGTTGFGGIVGNCSNGIISNCYNQGNVTASGMSAAGLISLINGNSKISNCYNIGKVNSGVISNNQKMEFGICSSVSGNPIFENCYYLDTSAVAPIDGKSDVKGMYEKITIDDISSQSFTDKLNKNRIALINQEFMYEWQYNKNSNPTFKKFNSGDLLIVKNTKIKNYVIKKVDKETGKPIANTKFVIYDMADNDFAKDFSGNYIGTLEDGKYIVKTNVNGEILVPLKGGIYKVEEIQAAKGYVLPKEEDRITYINVENVGTIVYEINYIEDLVNLSNMVKEGQSLENYKIILNKDLDFAEDLTSEKANNSGTASYNPADANREQLKTQMTSGEGFVAICGDVNNPFNGIFDGQGHKLKNIYQLSAPTVGIFGNIDGAVIKNIELENGSVISYKTNTVLLGYSINNCLIKNLKSSVNVSSGPYTASGLAYTMKNTIMDNYCNSGAVYGTGGGSVANIINNCTLINCQNMGRVEGFGSAGGVACSIYDSKIINYKNTGEIVSYSPGGGIAYFISNSLVINAANEGNVKGGVYVGGLAGSSNNSTYINCYNTGNINGTSGTRAGLIGSKMVSSTVINCYSTGTIDSTSKAELVYDLDENSTIENCYYLRSHNNKAISTKETYEEGSFEPITDEFAISQDFADKLNTNISKIDTVTELNSWKHIENSTPKFAEMETHELINGASLLQIANKQDSSIIVHHYKVGTGAEFNTEPVVLADDEIELGNKGEDYITSPKDNIKGYTVVKDENGDVILPENATGQFKEEQQHIYYYYEEKPYHLIVHHYLEGTEDKLDDDEEKTLDKNEHYKVTPSEEVLENYEFVKVEGTEEGDITEDQVVIYYYKIKEHEIITRVEIPEGRTDKGGSIIGEGEAPYETVIRNKNSVKEIIAKPDDGYRVKEIRLVSISEDGEKVETIIYGVDADLISEIKARRKSDGSVDLTQFVKMIADKEIIVVFEPNEGKVIVHHYIENTTEKLQKDELYVDIIGTEVKTTEKEKDNFKVVEKPNPQDTEITEEVQEKTYYYQEQFKITTDVIEHDEKYKDGTVVKNVKGGSISGEDDQPYDAVLKGRDSSKEIKITPDNGYKIEKILINGKEYVFDENDLDENGVLVLTDVTNVSKALTEDKHIEVKFVKESKVIVKYLEKPEDDSVEPVVLAPEIQIPGYEGKEYSTIKEIIPNYKDAKPSITDETGKTTTPSGSMFADDITVIYWYEKIKSDVIVRHIEINEKGDVTEIENEEFNGPITEKVGTSRKKYDGYISVNGKVETVPENVTIMSKNENSKEVQFKENVLQEIWYYYEKQFKITTEVRPHIEKDVDGKEVKVDGGIISKELKTDENGELILDDKGNKIELTYEEVLNRADSTKEIEIKPDVGYRVKSLEINGDKISLENIKKQEDGGITLEVGYFEDVQKDYHVVVEFEKIPSKVIVKYLDVSTGESVLDDKVVEGYLYDEYDEKRVDVDDYIPAEPEPNNSKGEMQEDVITVIYYYQKQYKITTEVKEHLEDKIVALIDVIVDKDDEKDDNADDSQVEKISVKGGSITGEKDKPYEVVIRGNNNEKEIEIVANENYRIKYIMIEGLLPEKTEDDSTQGGSESDGTNTQKGVYIDVDELTTEDGRVIIPKEYFKNMQSDKHIIVEFERITVNLVVNYLDVDTNEEVADSEKASGVIDQEYITHEKNIKYYKLVEDRIPENKDGKLGLNPKTDDQPENTVVVNYYYRKLLFNMKLNKVFTSVVVNGIEKLGDDNKFVEVSIPNTEVGNTSLRVKYKISVTNTEEIKGSAVVVEQIPVGFKVVENAVTDESVEKVNKVENVEKIDTDKWVVNENGEYQLNTRVLQPGETADYEIELEWDKSLNCIGSLENIAKITDTENPAEFGETTLDDNKDSCKLLLSIRTGKYGVTKTYVALACIGLAEILTVVYVVSVAREKKEEL